MPALQNLSSRCETVSAATTVLQTSISDLQLSKRGKVRDVYAVDEYFLIVATDRISAFDCILPTAIERKERY